MIVTMTVFAIVPVLLGAMGGVKRSEYLLKRSNPAIIERSYSAHQMDVDERDESIAAWDEMDAKGAADGVRPEVLAVGDVIVKRIVPDRKSLFWSKGIGVKDGVAVGEGLLYIELVAVDQLVDLGELPYAMVETIRTLIRLVLPFSIIIIVSLLTKADDKERLDRFYVKMRTPVIADRGQDRAEMDRSMANYGRYSERLLFGGSQFEFFKWNRVDWVGFLISVLAVAGIIVMLYTLLNVGSG